MYYPKNEFVYVHIPKTGGSSLEYFLGKLEEPDEYREGRTKFEILDSIYEKHKIEEGNTKHLIHHWAREYESKVTNYKNIHSFAFVRNPFSQIKSLYTMNEKANRNKTTRLNKWEDFFFKNEGVNINTYNKYIDQFSCVTNNSGEIIVKEIYPFEYYEDCVNHLSKKLNFKPDFDVRLWSTKPNNDFTPEMIELIMDKYGKSYELWKKVKQHWVENKKPYKIEE